MQVGTICYATRSGLGLLAKRFFEAGVVTRVLQVEHPHYMNYEFYPTAARYSREQADKFLAGLDVLLLFENALMDTWEVVRRARARGVPIAMMPMYEYTPKPLPVPADLYLCPSLLDLKYYEQLPAIFLPVPVDVPWALRKRARVFVHNAGHGGKNYRNGTPELLAAMPYVKSPIQLIVRGQPGERRVKRLFESAKEDPRVTLTLADVSDAELWAKGDVFIFPEKFNGLSLPLQEAYAAGMLVMASDRFPMNTWLPTEPLIPVADYVEDRIAVPITVAVIAPEAIAAAIDAWYDRDIANWSERGREWAKAHSWQQLKPRYLEALGRIQKCRS